MYKVVVDTLVLDRGIGEEDRFVAIVSEGTEFVGDDGNATDAGYELIKKAMVSEAVKAGATVIAESGCVDGGGDVETYSNDSVHAFNGGDITFGEEPILTFMEENGLLINRDDLLVKMPPKTDFAIGKAYKQPVVQIVNLLVLELVDFIVTKFSWAKQNEFLIRSIVKMIAGENGVGEYADKIFTDVQAKINS